MLGTFGEDPCLGVVTTDLCTQTSHCYQTWIRNPYHWGIPWALTAVTRWPVSSTWKEAWTPDSRKLRGQAQTMKGQPLFSPNSIISEDALALSQQSRIIWISKHPFRSATSLSLVRKCTNTLAAKERGQSAQAWETQKPAMGWKRRSLIPMEFWVSYLSWNVARKILINNYCIPSFFLLSPPLLSPLSSTLPSTSLSSSPPPSLPSFLKEDCYWWKREMGIGSTLGSLKSNLH